MKFKFFFGGKPKFSQQDRACFSDKKYKCELLLQNRKGEPVAISQHKDTGVWRVSFGFSTVFFATYDEALAYCKGRFFDLDGKVV